MGPEVEMTRAAQAGGHVRTSRWVHPIAKSLLAGAPPARPMNY